MNRPAWCPKTTCGFVRNFKSYCVGGAEIAGARLCVYNSTINSGIATDIPPEELPAFEAALHGYRRDEVPMPDPPKDSVAAVKAAPAEMEEQGRKAVSLYDVSFRPACEPLGPRRVTVRVYAVDALSALFAAEAEIGRAGKLTEYGVDQVIRRSP